MSMPSTFAGVIARRAEIKADLDARSKAHRDAVAAAEAELKGLAATEALLAGGVDPKRIQRGLHVIYISGSHKQGGACASVITDAKAALAAGGGGLHREYFGCKDYAHWTCQRSDHPYGYGPKHGSTVFSIGLTQAARKQELTPEQIEDALFVLANIDALDTARKVAA